MRFHQRTLRSGTVAIMVLFCMVMLMSLMAFAIDGGMVLHERRHIQMTADAAAMAAAVSLYLEYPNSAGSGPQSEAVLRARNIVRNNGVSEDYWDMSQATSNVWSGGSWSKAAGTGNLQIRFGSAVNSNIYSMTSTQSPSYQDPLASGCVEVILTYYQKRFFSGIWGSQTFAIQGRAVAKGAWVSPKDGVIVTDYDDKQALTDKGGGTINIYNGNFVVNSSDPQAVLVSGGSDINIYAGADGSGGSFNVTGGIQVSGGGSGINTYTNSGTSTSEVWTGIHPTPDPFAYLPTPTMPGNGTAITTSTGDWVLRPGRYTSSNLPNFTGSGKKVIFDGNGMAEPIFWFDTTFNPSNHTVMMATGASVGTTTTTNTTGLMIYQNSGSFTVQGNGGGTGSALAPLQSGDYKGITFWQPATNTNDVSISGNGSVQIDGTFYAPGALATITGNGSANSIGSQWVVKNFKVAGNGDVSILYNPAKAAKTRVITLVE